MFKKLLLTCILGLGGLSAQHTFAKAHPQDGLSPEEIKQIKSLMLENQVSNEQSLYPLFELIEPSKDDVYAWRNGGKIPARKATVHFRKGDKFFITQVDLTNKTVAEAKPTTGQPMILLEEFFGALELTLQNEAFISALAKRNLKPSQVHCNPLTAGNFGQDTNKRLFKVPCFETPKGENFYSKPIEGLYALVDGASQKVLEVVDTGVIPVAKDEWDYTEAAVEKRVGLRPKWNPVKLKQEGAPNYKIDGGQIEWDIWKFHYRVDKRPGPVISDVQVNDGKKWRDVMYQMHLSEVFVPYMEPSKAWNFRTYMDSGEYGFGVFLSPLRAGVDCPKYATFLPAILNDDMGNPLEIPNAICVFERDTGNPSWRHFEIFKMTETFVPDVEGRPETELVFRSASEVGNYDYLIDYVFKQNGDIRIKVGASGLDATKGVKSVNVDSNTYAEDTKYGSLIAPNLVAANHDHYFNFRMDMDVDGRDNIAMKTKIVPMKDKVDGNLRGPMWKVKHEVIEKETDGKMKFSAMKPKYFMMVNPNKKGPLNIHPGYMIHHGNLSYGPYDFQGDTAMKRNAYIENTVWTTLHDRKQRYAGGQYALGSDGSDTLAQWVKEDKDIQNKDIVTWFTAGFHHIPRVEDWPVMTTEWLQIHLQPMNFFSHNPAMTLRSSESEDANAKTKEKSNSKSDKKAASD